MLTTCLGSEIVSTCRMAEAMECNPCLEHRQCVVALSLLTFTSVPCRRVHRHGGAAYSGIPIYT